jgi:hypothetical protein
MDYKPDESTLIAYLYGELNGQEAERLQQYFEEHPGELINLQEMAAALKLMGRVEDKEVIAPPVFTEQESTVRLLWNSPAFRTIASIAASMLLILVAGKFLGTEINYSSRELRISFGGTTTKPPIETVVPASVSAEAVQQMINASMNRNNEALAVNWKEDQHKLDESIRRSLQQNSKKVDDLIKNTSAASQDQLRSFVAGLQNENLHLMKDYFQLSASEQKKYVEGLLVDFSKYLQEQRTQDMMLVQSKVNSIEKNSDTFKQETEQILASIISNKQISPNKKNSY